MSALRQFVLRHDRAPGDVTVMTALVRDIALTYPGKYQVGVKTSAMDLWRHNPYVTKLPSTAKEIILDYGQGLKDQKVETVHFLSYFHRDFKKKTGIDVPLTFPTPDLHLSDEEKNISPIEGRYWVFLSGGKSDVTVKVWDHRYWQQLVDIMRGWGLGMVQLGSTDHGHFHPYINGALNLVGKTNLRDMMRLLWHAEGAVCGITCAMHMSAALQKPCVVIAGGRESWGWEAYCRENTGLGGKDVAAKLKVPHRYLHTIGLLECCRSFGGCWTNKIVKLGRDNNICKQPVIRPGQAIPKCLDLIQPQFVATMVASYYLDGTLPPLEGLNLENLQQM